MDNHATTHGGRRGLVVVIAVMVAGCVGMTWRSVRVITSSDIGMLGEAVPDVVLHFAGRSATTLHAQLAVDRLTVIPIFSPECQSCVGEARVWQKLSEVYQQDVRIIGAASTINRALVDVVRREARISFPITLIEADAIKAMGIRGLPAILVLDGKARRIFQATGPGSTAALEEWLADGERSSVVGG